MTQRVDIWVESSGLGHVTRQINLVSHLRSRADCAQVQVRFLVDESPAIQGMLTREGHEFVVRRADVANAFEELGAGWKESSPVAFILDSVYHDRNPAAAAVLTHSRVFSFVIVDDPEDRDVGCDLLMNALPGKSSDRERQAGQYLRGTQYLILPREYELLRDRSAARSIGDCRKGFAFFGGSDPENLAGVFLDMIASGTTVPEWRLLLGPASPFAAGAIERVKREELPVKCEHYVPSMGETLLGSDIAVLAAGNIVSEAAAVGTPVIALSHHGIQKQNAEFFAARGGAIDLGLPSPDLSVRLGDIVNRLAADTELRGAMSKAMLSIVDGLGGRRVAEILARSITA